MNRPLPLVCVLAVSATGHVTPAAVTGPRSTAPSSSSSMAACSSAVLRTYT